MTKLDTQKWAAEFLLADTEILEKAQCVMQLPLDHEDSKCELVCTGPFSTSISLHGCSGLPFSIALVRIFLPVVP